MSACRLRDRSVGSCTRNRERYRNVNDGHGRVACLLYACNLGAKQSEAVDEVCDGLCLRVGHAVQDALSLPHAQCSGEGTHGRHGGSQEEFRYVLRGRSMGALCPVTVTDIRLSRSPATGTRNGVSRALSKCRMLSLSSRFFTCVCPPTACQGGGHGWAGTWTRGG